jgi:hypothetical protein
VSQATHRFLVLLREFDIRQGWKAYGNADCAEWLDWRCGIARVTAQEKVRVAHALWGLPRIEAAFAAGDLSYSKVRALCRVVTQRNERDLLDYALRSSAAQVEAYCRRLRCGDAVVSAADARRIHERRWLSRTVRDDGSGVITVELPQAELELVLAALDAVANTLPEDPDRSIFATGADALVRMAETMLGENGFDGSGKAAPAIGFKPVEVVVHIDASALSGAGGESDLPLPAVRRLCCDGAVVPLIEDADGNALDVGRRQRVVSTPMKRALVARDRGCTYPGCHHTRYLDAHHVEHWTDGGATQLDNLLTLCSMHHRLVHEAGFTIQRNGDGTYYFTRPDGRPVVGRRVTRDGGDDPHDGHDMIAEPRPRYVVGAIPRNGDGALLHAGLHAGSANSLSMYAIASGCVVASRTARLRPPSSIRPDPPTRPRRPVVSHRVRSSLHRQSIDACVALLAEQIDQHFHAILERSTCIRSR